MPFLTYLKFLGFLIGFIMLTGCSLEEDLQNVNHEEILQIKANVGSSTTIAGNPLIAQNEFGLFVKSSNAADFTNLLENNRKFIYNTTNSTFKLEGENIYYPQTGNIDLIGYAPYKAGIIDTYKVDVSDQTDQNAIDLIYSNSSKNINKSTNAVPLTFSHQLSKIKFNIQLIDGNSSLLESSKISLNGFYNKADFDLVSGAFTNQTVSSQPILLNTARAGIIIPNNGLANRKIEFSFNNDIWTYELPDSEIFEAGKQYEYTISINKKSVIIQLSNIVSWANNSSISQTETVNTLPLEYVYIPSGTFQMGAPDTADIHVTVAKPQHWVKITKGFYMSKNEITVAQYAEFLNALGVVRTGNMNYDPINHEINGETITLFKIGSANSPIYENNRWKAYSGHENHPVTHVSKDGALAYAKWAGGTLPTEAQWEYAYRAGTNTKFFNGNLASEFRPYAWFFNLDMSSSIQPVGLKKPNPWGLHDIAGNVNEWVLDQFQTKSMYSGNTEQTPEIDPVKKGTPNFVMCRGGDSFSSGNNSSAYMRYFISPSEMSNFIGFRIVINPN